MVLFVFHFLIHSNMKSYLNDSDDATPAEITTSAFRRPFKLLQNFINSNMASSASSPPLKTIGNRPKKVDTTSQSRDANIKNRIVLASRQTVVTKSASNYRSKSPNLHKKVDQNNLKSKISESSDGSTSSVGSLASSPKWSHIKNRFESSESVSSSKASATKMDTKKTPISIRTTKEPSNSVNSSYIHRNKYLSARKDTEKNPGSHFNKFESSPASSKTIKEKHRLSPNLKNESPNLKARSSSPKNSSQSIPAANVSSLHSSHPIKKYSSNTNSMFKGTHQSNSSSPEGSVKGSRCSSPNTSFSSSTAKPNLTNSSISSNSEKLVSSFSKISSKTSNDSSHTTMRTAVSTLNSSNVAKKDSEISKSNLFTKPTLKHEEKPASSYNLCSKPLNKPTAGERKDAKHSAESKPEGIAVASVLIDTKRQESSTKEKVSPSLNKTQIKENIEKIKDLAKNSQSAPKTVWVKDSAGNWVKKVDANAKTLSSSKVASLRSKFMEPSTVPITKSSTTSSVPSKSVLFSRPIAKSSTTNSISSRTILQELTHKLNSGKDAKGANVSSSIADEASSNSLVNDKAESQDEDSQQMSIVQRAVMSFEGTIPVPSPETQKRLKLVSEKVQAQTDDGKILKAKAKNIVHTSAKSQLEKTDSNPNKNVIYASKKPSGQEASKPSLPVQNFLARYQSNKTVILNKQQNKNSSESENKSKPAVKSFRPGSVLCMPKEGAIKESQAGVFKVPNKTGSADKAVTKLTMNLKLPNGNIDMKSISEENEYTLQPNSSFLWRRSEKCPSEISKSSTASSVSLTSSDYRNYYDIDNYYSSLELEIDKGSEISEEHIYIDSQESNSSDNYAMSTYSDYQNVSNGRPKNGSQDEWTDISEDDCRKTSISSNQSSTLKKKKTKRFFSLRENSSSYSKSQNQQRRPLPNDTYSFTDSSDTLINDEVGNESTYDLSDANHFYEPVYESLGNYLLSPEEEENYENCSDSGSPEDLENADIMQCSITSLESADGSQVDSNGCSRKNENIDEKNLENKKGVNKISQLKRHLSWTKNDIRLELSSKFNRIKIKKNGSNATEIGLKMQDSENVNTSPKKKTFIKCILRQKSANNIPLKRSPSPKKESAMFYVHLTMGREKQRPFSDSLVATEPTCDLPERIPYPRKQSDSALLVNPSAKSSQAHPRPRKFNSGQIIQRPKTPPPLPPVQANGKLPVVESAMSNSLTSATYDTCEMDSELYTVLDEDHVSDEIETQTHSYKNEVLNFVHADTKQRASKASSVDGLVNESVSSSRRCSKAESRTSDMNLPLLQNFHSENLKSPFEEEPMYQFYQKDVQQRATLWYSVDGSESEFEDDVSSRLSDPDYQNPKRPVLQSQLSAMDLVHGDGGQRRLWCEVPEVIESGILKSLSQNDRKIQEAMFEVITSEASYLKSLNFLIEHFVQCPEFSGDFADKHVLDKRERHILFSDIQPVRDVSASLLGDLEKRWLKDIVLSDICDILYHHAKNHFSVYVKYCSNQLYQERLLRELKEKRPDFVTVLKKLEANAVCQGLDMHSFLMLPMQRITRLPLLIDAIFRRLSVDSPIYESCKSCLATVNKIVAECNEGACKMQRMEEMLVISQQIDFNACKGLGLLSASRWLVKKGELVQLLMDNSNRRTFSRNSRWCKIQLYLFLFTDLLVVTRKKSDDSYNVVDYCPRNMLQVMPVDENMPPLSLRLPSSYRNVFQLILLNNRDGKTVEMLLSCLLESDRTRWMSAVMPAKSENPDEKIYEEWDCPQVQCTHAYNAQQPDELSLEEADVVNVFKKMADGWYEGERIRDGIRGWFPSSHTVEIINSHVRARNLHQRYRLLMLSQTYLEEQYKAQAQSKK